jgi:ADP-ribose pyrophosphatase YjhB (NUDIX family)
VGAVVIESGRLLVIKRGRPPAQGLWAVPGGKVAWGETMRATARREVKEETGLEVEVGEVVWAGDSIGPGAPPDWHYCLVDFLASPVGGDLMAGDDAADARWVTRAEAEALPLTATMPSLMAVLKDLR